MPSITSPHSTQPHSTVADRLREAAFDLFVEQGYDATSVDEIAEHAGVGRSTYFRTFPTKEAVIFPDHEQVLARIQARLEATEPGQHFLALREAARLVLRHYLDEGDHARARYRLTRSVPALREREIAGMQRYQETFRAFIRGWDTNTETADALRVELHSELLAAALVTAHNHVLRRWLRGTTLDPVSEFDAAMAQVEQLFAPRETPPRLGGHVVVIGPGTDLDDALSAVRDALS